MLCNEAIQSQSCLLQTPIQVVGDGDRSGISPLLHPGRETSVSVSRLRFSSRVDRTGRRHLFFPAPMPDEAARLAGLAYLVAFFDTIVLARLPHDHHPPLVAPIILAQVVEIGLGL